VQENHLQVQTVIPSILLWYLSAYRLEFGFNSCRQFKGYVSLLQVMSAMVIFVFLPHENRKAKRAYLHNNCYVSKFPTLFLALV